MENTLSPIAKTIIDQINYNDCCALNAWGASNFSSLLPSKEFQGGIKFSVDGVEFKGIVKIELRWVDDYLVSFIRNGRLQHQVKHVYHEALVDVIDYVEGKKLSGNVNYK
ncbi:MAG: hypothetical protein ACKOXB_13170 [Flavobacteriales bacterium]